MKTATRNLEDDHIHILRLIDVMEQITTSADPDISSIEKVIVIIKDFADGLHHAKEETIFFPLLAERGFSTSQGPVAVMLHEHVKGRSFVKGMEEAISSYKKNDKNAIGEIYLYMNLYADLLRSHISKENDILFRMADRVLSETDHIYLLARFNEAEKIQSSTSGALEFHNMIDELVSQYVFKT